MHDSPARCAGTVSGKYRCVGDVTLSGKVMNYVLPRPSAMPCPVNQYKRHAHNMISLISLSVSNTDRHLFEIQQQLRIPVKDQFALSCRTAEAFDEFRRHIVVATGMVSAIEHLLGPQNSVATFKCFDVVANGIHIQLADVVADRIFQM